MAKLAKIEPKQVPASEAKKGGPSGKQAEAPAQSATPSVVATKAPAPSEKPPSEWKENVAAILIVAVIVVAAWGLMAGWFRSPPPPIPVSEQLFPIGFGNAPVLGDYAAPVTIIEFSDFRCSACKAFHERTFPLLKEEFIDTGKARFAYRNYPIVELHPDAFVAAVAAWCAGEQERFWEFHDALYANEGRITEAWLNATAEGMGLDLEAFAACRASEEAANGVAQDELDGINQGGVSATPTFFVNGRRIVGDPGIAAFRELIGKEPSQNT